MEIFKPVLQQHRSVKTVTLNTAFWIMQLGKNVTGSRPNRPPLKIKKPNDVDVICLSRADGVTEKKKVHFGSYLQNLNESTVNSFMADCANHANLLQLGVEPKIGTKQSKKDEADEVIEAQPLPKDFFKDEDSDEKKPTRKLDSVGNREKLESEDEKIVEDVDDSELQQEPEEQEEEDEGDEVEL